MWREEGDVLRSTAGGVGGVSGLSWETTSTPVCGEAGEAGTMTAVPSSAMRSCRARLKGIGERVRVGGDRAPLSRPLTRPRGSIRSNGSSKDSMAAAHGPPTLGKNPVDMAEMSPIYSLSGNKLSTQYFCAKASR